MSQNWKELIRHYLPSLIFSLYVLVALAEIILFFGIMGLERGSSDDFFSELGLLGGILWYPIGAAVLLAFNPLIYGLGLTSCGGSFIKLCIPSLAGTVLNLFIALILVFVTNFVVVKSLGNRKK